MNRRQVVRKRPFGLQSLAAEDRILVRPLSLSCPCFGVLTGCPRYFLAAVNTANRSMILGFIRYFRERAAIVDGTQNPVGVTPRVGSIPTSGTIFPIASALRPTIAIAADARALEVPDRSPAEVEIRRRCRNSTLETTGVGPSSTISSCVPETPCVARV